VVRTLSSPSRLFVPGSGTEPPPIPLRPMLLPGNLPTPPLIVLTPDEVSCLDFDRIHWDIQQAAIHDAEQGLRVIRLYGPRPDPATGELICSCWRGAECGQQVKPAMKTSPGKHPVDVAWTKQGVPSSATINRWFDENPWINIGIQSGLDFKTIDVDIKPEKNVNGFIDLNRLQEIHGQLPETRMSRSGSGAAHLHFQIPPGRSVRVTGFGGAEGIDANCTMVVAAPSLHPSGYQYQVILDIPPSLAPAWFWEAPALKSRIRGEGHSTRSKKINVSKHDHVQSEHDGLVEKKIRELDARPDDLKAELAESTLKLLRRGDPEGNQSEIVQSIMLGAANRRFPIDKLFYMLADSKNIGGLGLQTRMNERGFDSVVDGWMRTNWRSVQELRAEEMIAVDQIREDIDLYEWKTVAYLQNGKIERATAKSMRRVLHAALDIAHDLTTLHPQVSKTKIESATRIHRETIRHALHGVEKLGWLETKQVSNGAATIYHFLPGECRRNRKLSDPERPEDLLVYQEEPVPVRVPTPRHFLKIPPRIPGSVAHHALWT
jgi:hypothetical protein